MLTFLFESMIQGINVGVLMGGSFSIHAVIAGLEGLVRRGCVVQGMSHALEVCWALLGMQWRRRT